MDDGKTAVLVTIKAAFVIGAVAAGLMRLRQDSATAPTAGHIWSEKEVEPMRMTNYDALIRRITENPEINADARVSQLLEIILDAPTFEFPTEDLMLAVASYTSPHAEAKFELLKAIQKLSEAVQQWIPVTDRLPKEWVEVLVWSRCGFHETAVYLGIPGKWRITWNHALLEEGTVTHWMPLPKPPGTDQT